MTKITLICKYAQVNSWVRGADINTHLKAVKSKENKYLCTIKEGTMILYIYPGN